MPVETRKRADEVFAKLKDGGGFLRDLAALYSAGGRDRKQGGARDWEEIFQV